MKRDTFKITLLLLSLSLPLSCDRGKGKSEEEVDTDVAALQQAIAPLLTRDDIIIDWDLKLRGDEPIRTEPINLSEVEELWLQAPILFIGYLDEIAVRDKEHFILFVSYGGFYWADDIKVELTCPKQFASFLRNKDDAWFGVAVTAEIQKVRPGLKPSVKGTMSFVYTGIGRCLNVVDLGQKVATWSIKRWQFDLRKKGLYSAPESTAPAIGVERKQGKRTIKSK